MIMTHDWLFVLLSVLGLLVLWCDVAFVNQSCILFRQSQPIGPRVVFEMNSDLLLLFALLMRRGHVVITSQSVSGLSGQETSTDNLVYDTPSSLDYPSILMASSTFPLHSSGNGEESVVGDGESTMDPLADDVSTGIVKEGELESGDDEESVESAVPKNEAGTEDLPISASVASSEVVASGVFDDGVNSNGSRDDIDSSDSRDDIDSSDSRDGIDSSESRDDIDSSESKDDIDSSDSKDITVPDNPKDIIHNPHISNDINNHTPHTHTTPPPTHTKTPYWNQTSFYMDLGRLYRLPSPTFSPTRPSPRTLGASAPILTHTLPADEPASYQFSNAWSSPPSSMTPREDRFETLRQEVYAHYRSMCDSQLPLTCRKRTRFDKMASR